MSLGRILLADNLEDHLLATGEYLELEGYEIILARTLDDAEDALKHRWFHLAILDIRMVDDDDEDDLSGLLLAKNTEYRSTPKIMFTGYPTYKSVVEALSPKVGEMPAAVAYVSKQEGPTKLLEAVQQAYKSNVCINFNLAIRWLPESLLSLQRMLTWIDPALPVDQLQESTEELVDLFCKAFYEYEWLTISTLLWVKNERLCLEAFAGFGADETHWLLTCGKSGDICLDHQTERIAAPKSYPFAGVTHLEETLHYALIARDISTYGLARVKTLDKALGEMSEKQTKVAFENLYLSQLSGWRQPRLHGEPSPRADSLAESYCKHLGMVPLPELSRLLRAIENLVKQKGTEELVVNLKLTGSELHIRFKNSETLVLPDPIARLSSQTAFPEMEVRTGLTLNTLNGRNVVLTRPEVVLPIDFSGIAVGPILTDYLALETDIRFHRMGVSNLLTLLDFERQLLNATSLFDSVKTSQVEPECGKALVAILAIRNTAAKETKSALAPYLLGLYYYCMSGLLELDPDVQLIQDEIVVGLHRLLLAGLLCRVLDQHAASDLHTSGDQPDIELPALKLLHERHAAQLGNRIIPLTPTEYELFSYLYNFQGQICKREDILREVFKISKPNSRTDKGLINTNIGRLRQKIESNASKPQYILTVPGAGYRLDIKPEE